MAGKPARPAFNSFPSSFDYGATSRRGKQVTIRLRLTSGATRRRQRLSRGIRLRQGYDVTRATTFAPGSERGELGAEEETDYATTE
jgi:hypothetical protein